MYALTMRPTRNKSNARAYVEAKEESGGGRNPRVLVMSSFGSEDPNPKHRRVGERDP